MHIEKKYKFTVSPDFAGYRLDSFLSSSLGEMLSRSALTGEKCVFLVNNTEAKKSMKVKEGDCVEFLYVAEVFEKIEKQDLPLDIIFEDENMLVINKAQGMPVHPGAGNPNGTVVNALAFRYGDKFLENMSSVTDLTRPGIVHRLDKDTSGVLVVALTPYSHSKLSQQFQDRLTEKYYVALCDGVFFSLTGEILCNLVRNPNNRKLFTVSKNSKGKDSHSSYTVIKQYEKNALVKIRIYTGRTHQIRVHMKSIGHAVTGDSLYNNRCNSDSCSLMLHSFSLAINHPVTGEKMYFEAPLPKRFSDLVGELPDISLFK